MVQGRGQFRNGDARHPFGPGDVLFVPAGVVHRFEEFTDDLVVWVFFYGPEGGEASRMTAPEPPPRGLQRTLHRDYYRTEAAFVRERERIFFPEWFCFGREEEVAGAGDCWRGRWRARACCWCGFPTAGSRRTTTSAATAAPGWCPSAARGTSRPGSAAPTTRGPTISTAGSAPRPISMRATAIDPETLSLHPVEVASWGGFVFVPAGAETADRPRSPGSWAPRAGAGPALPAGRAAGGAPDRVPGRGQLEGDARELQRVLPLRAGPPGAVPAGAGLQAAGRVGAGLGAGHPAPRGRLDLHRLGHHQPRAVPRPRCRRAGAPQGRAGLPQPDAQSLRRSRRRVPAPARGARAHHGGLRVPLPSRRDGPPRIRPERRGGVLGSGEPAGLDDLRVGAAGHGLAPVHHRLLRADGELEPRHPALRRRAARAQGRAWPNRATPA